MYRKQKFLMTVSNVIETKAIKARSAYHSIAAGNSQRRVGSGQWAVGVGSGQRVGAGCMHDRYTLTRRPHVIVSGHPHIGPSF